MRAHGLYHEALTRSIIGGFYEVYNQLGYGYLEQVYAHALERELVARNHRVVRELTVRLRYKGDEVGTCRLDMVVDETVLIETKSTFALHESAERQLLNYLSASRLDVGLLLHFGPKPRFRRLIRSDLTPVARRRAAGS